jgi:hypothetical protein
MSRAEPSPQPPAADFEPRPASPATESRGAATANGAAASERASNAKRRSGLGTEFGEAVSSEIREVPFERESSTVPARVLGARYNDRAGLLALGIDLDGCELPCDLALRSSADPFPSSPRHYARPPRGWLGF